MATTNFASFADCSTDANFRAWGSALSSAFATIGLIQTADTGQINWTTVTHPTLSSTAQGYEIWRFNDSLQSTAPVFFKIEYGSGSVAAAPGIWITTGLGSNGAGAITSPSTRFQIDATTSNTSNQFTSYVAGDSGGLGFFLWATATNASIPIFFGIERAKTSAGADTGAYMAVFAFAATGTSIPLFYTQMASGAVTQESINVPGPLTKQTNTQAGGNVALVPVMPCVGFFNYPLRRVIVGMVNDWVNGDTPAISLYTGITDQYLVIKPNNAACIFGPSAANLFCILMRNQ